MKAKNQKQMKINRRMRFETHLQQREAAFYSGNGSKRPKKCPDKMECYNCHKKGHMAKDCWAKGGGKEGQNPRRKGQGKANIAQAESTTDAAWFVANYDITKDHLLVL